MFGPPGHDGAAPVLKSRSGTAIGGLSRVQVRSGRAQLTAQPATPGGGEADPTDVSGARRGVGGGDLEHLGDPVLRGLEIAAALVDLGEDTSGRAR